MITYLPLVQAVWLQQESHGSRITQQDLWEQKFWEGVKGKFSKTVWGGRKWLTALVYRIHALILPCFIWLPLWPGHRHLQECWQNLCVQSELADSAEVWVGLFCFSKCYSMSSTRAGVLSAWFSDLFQAPITVPDPHMLSIHMCAHRAQWAEPCHRLESYDSLLGVPLELLG